MSYKTKDAEYEAVLRGILTARAKEGATVDEIRNDFKELLGEVPDVLNDQFENIKRYMASINGVVYAIERDMYLWFYHSPNTRHITQMIEQQKPPRNGGRYVTNQSNNNNHHNQRHQPYASGHQASRMSYPPTHRQQQQHYQQQQQRHQPQQQQPSPQQTHQHSYPASMYLPMTTAAGQQHQQHQQHQPTAASQPNQPPIQRKSFHNSANSCFFKDNMQFRMNRQFYSEPSLMTARSRSNTSLNSATSSGSSSSAAALGGHIGGGGHRSSTGGQSQGQGQGCGGNGGGRPNQSASQSPFLDHRPAFLYEYQLIGDDFLLALATTDLDASLAHDGCRARRSGLCISGLTISDAAKRVSQLLVPIDENVIVNIGSVDLLHGHEFADMKRDFMHLMEAFQRRQIVPVITTLAPLANHCHLEETRRKWNFFNTFLLKQFPALVLDITVCFRSTDGRTLHDCYQPMAKYVSGSCQPHTLWNRLGRQRVLAFLKKNVYENFDVIDR